MSPLDRPLADPMMTFDLQEEIDHLRQDEAFRRSGRAGRTLAKSGRLRLVLVVMAQGIEIGVQQADSPMTVQLLEGRIRYLVGGREHQLGAGQVLFFGPGEAHQVRAMEETVILLTMSMIGPEYQ
jgi:quercetin dioxygenase-like cupin family protein